MIFNSFEFLWSFPLIFCVYYLIISQKSINDKWPKIGNFILLVISYGLYLKWKPVYGLVLFGVTAITYYFALLIEKKKAFGQKRYIIFLGITLALLPLLIFKYYNFLNDQLIVLLHSIGIETGLPGLNWAMPLGISFFTLQAIGYLADVYLQRIKAEHNFGDYMLFVSFFPQIASGPISKAKDLLPQIKAQRSFNYNQAVQGLKWLLWGMFLKVVVADRLGMRVDNFYLTYQSSGGFDCFIVSLLYTFQIYCDFAGYSFMALGVGEILGFELINNFNRPYFSQSITEFWHRWHISLSTWLKDYIYIPLGGSRCSKARNYWNIFVTFLVSGLWHGANWTFIVWGLLHGIFQIIDKIFGLNKLKSHGIIKSARICFTLLLVNFAWIFFRMPTFEDAFQYIYRIFTNYSGNIMQFMGAFAYIAIVLSKDLIDEYQIKPLSLFHHKYTIVRWVTYLILLFMIAIDGVFGGQFIYSGF